MGGRRGEAPDLDGVCVCVCVCLCMCVLVWLGGFHIRLDTISGFKHTTYTRAPYQDITYLDGLIEGGCGEGVGVSGVDLHHHHVVPVALKDLSEEVWV
jgi:hypothetical protein